MSRAAEPQPVHGSFGFEMHEDPIGRLPGCERGPRRPSGGYRILRDVVGKG